MKLPHLFEFMDLKWLPASLHATLREILECGNARPFRPYYEWVADAAHREVTAANLDSVVELGAGTAPISRVMASQLKLDQLQLVVCDSQPDRATYEDLARRFPGIIVPRYESVDFSQPQQWPEKSLLLLSGTLHHIPEEPRRHVLANLVSSGRHVMVCEPLRKTLPSAAFVLLSAIPAVLLPLWFLGRPGRVRRFIWCWLLPVAPVIFWWDGLISCLRMWTAKQWRDAIQEAAPVGTPFQIKESLFSQRVIISPKG
jgi:hypothetical protein